MTEAVDMSQFIEAKSDQLNSDDLIGRTLTITITKVTGSDSDQPVAIHFEGDNGKPFKPCKTVRRVLVAIWGRYASEYVGRAMTLYRDDSVQFGGLQVGGIRVSHMSHLDKETVVVVAKSKGKKAGMKILPLKADQQQQKPDAARNWANGFLSQVASAPGLPSLENFVTGKAAKLAEMKAKKPELHAECEKAVEARRASFAGSGSDDFADDDDPFGDETPEPYAAYITAVTKRIEEATATAELDEIAGTLADAQGIPEDQLTALDTAIVRKRRALGKGGAGG